MKFGIMLFLLIMAGYLFPVKAGIELFFWNEPKFRFDDYQSLSKVMQQLEADTLDSYLFFTGRILKKYEGDIFPLAFLQMIGCDYASPTDYFYHSSPPSLNFRLLAANLDSDSLDIAKQVIIATDSLRIGIFSLYTPDFVVKNQLAPSARLDMDVFAIARERATALSRSCDLVIMISNLSKSIDEDITREIPVDIVFSSDYQKQPNGYLSNKSTRFYSLLSHQGVCGRLKLERKQGKVVSSWQELKFSLKSAGS